MLPGTLLLAIPALGAPLVITTPTTGPINLSAYLDQTFDALENQSSITASTNGYAVTGGDVSSIELEAGSSLVNGVNGNGIQVSSATTISNAGTITVGGVSSSYNSGAAIAVTGTTGSFVNSGQITNSGYSAGDFHMDMGAEGYGIQLSRAVSSFTNSGSIEGVNSGAYFGRDVGSFNNSGTIRSTRNYAVNGNRFDSFVNSGTIIGPTSVSVAAVIANSGLGSLLNDVGGKISGEWGLYLFSGSSGVIENRGIIEGADIGIRVFQGSIDNIINSGTISGGTHAVFFNSTGQSYLITLRTGSKIHGQLTYGNGTDDKLDISGFAGSAVINTTGLETIIAGGKHYLATPDKSTITIFEVATPTSTLVGATSGQIVGAINSLAQGEIFSTASDTELAYAPTPADSEASQAVLSALDVKASNTAWANVVGGGAVTRTPVESTSLYAGIVAGAHARLASGVELGLLGGYVRTATQNLGTTQPVNADGAVLGLYGRAQMQAAELSFSLLGGYNQHSSARDVVVLAGTETASANYGSWYAAPTLGIDLPVLALDGATLYLTADATYVGGMVAGYSETGSSMNMTVGEQTISAFHGRVGLEARVIGNGVSFRTKAGVLADANAGTATMPVSIAGAGSVALAGTPDTLGYGAYAGAAMDATLGNGLVLTSALDASAHLDGSLAAHAKAGVTGAF